MSDNTSHWRVYNIREAAEFLGISISLMRRLIAEGDIFAKDAGRRKLILESTLIEFCTRPQLK